MNTEEGMHTIFINCDGGSRGNPGPAAIGIVLWDSQHKKIKAVGERIGRTTNNVAEYTALCRAFELAQDCVPCALEVCMDSELVIKHLTGQYKLKATHLKPLFDKAKALEKHFEKVTYKAVPRSDPHQQEADRLVNEALDTR